MTRQIAWEHFVPPEDEMRTVQKMEDFDDEEMDEEQEQIHNMGLELLALNSKIKTPFGHYDVNDPFSPYNMFDCWIGHTNFPLTIKEENILDTKIDGIGALKILSKYRFFIGLEKMFAFPIVRVQIQKELCNNLTQNEIVSNDFDSLFNRAMSRVNEAYLSLQNAEKWAIFIGNDGTIQTLSNKDVDTDDEYQVKLNTLKSLKDGNIITCDSI